MVKSDPYGALQKTIEKQPSDEITLTDQLKLTVPNVSAHINQLL